MTSLRALRRPGMSLRSALALHVNMTAALSPWMFRFELGALHQRSVANTSKMLWRRRGFNSQVEKQLIKTRRTYRKRKICKIFVMQEIGFGSYVDSLNSKATALSSLVEGFDTRPHEQSIPFACKWDSVLGDANPSAVTVTVAWCHRIMFLSARTWFKFGMKNCPNNLKAASQQANSSTYNLFNRDVAENLNAAGSWPSAGSLGHPEVHWSVRRLPVSNNTLCRLKRSVIFSYCKMFKL